MIQLGKVRLCITSAHTPPAHLSVTRADLYVAHMDVQRSALFGDLRRVQAGERDVEGIAHL